MPKLVASEVERSLRDRISAGEWSLTGQMPTEREIALEYSVARNTARKAISAIVDDGLVARHVGRGTFILGQDDLELGSILGRITDVSPADLMDVRRVLEPQAAAIAAACASSNDLQQIAQAHANAVNAKEVEAFEYWDGKFHQRIFTASRNELLTIMHDVLLVIRTRAPWIELKKKRFSEQRRQLYCGHHGKILEALQARDSNSAAAAMETHLDSIRDNLFNHRTVPVE